MNADLSEKLQGILNDRDAVEKLRQIAGNLNLSQKKEENESTERTDRRDADFEGSDRLMYSSNPENSQNGQQNAEKSESSEENSENKTYLKGKTHTSDDHINLILALRPFLSDDRKETADRIVQLLKLLKIADISKLLRG
mgnify:CR=1